MKDGKINIMVIDDHPIIHDGLDTLLSMVSDFEIIADAYSSDEALSMLKTITPDIAIIDLTLGSSDGISLIHQIKKRYPDLLMLVYTMSEEKIFAERTAAAGAHGYVMKTVTPSLLRDAIRTIYSGSLYYSPESKRRILKNSQIQNHGLRSLLDSLTNREMEIFKQIGEGLDSTTISELWEISRNTVDTHRINIKNKLMLPNGKALDRLAFEVIKKGKLRGDKRP